MKKIMFFIHDLNQGGAEKVLVNLVNNMDSSVFDITVIALFGGGVNEQFLKPNIKYKSLIKKEFPANSRLLRLFTPEQLHKWFIREKFDIEVSYLEGPSARIVSGCPHAETKLVSWIHVEQHEQRVISEPFRSFDETLKCYNRFDQTVCVSQYVKSDFERLLSFNKPCTVLYNTVETEKIQELSRVDVSNLIDESQFNIIAIGTLKKTKGYIRLFHIIQRLKDIYPVHLFVLGSGPQEKELRNYIEMNHLEESISLLGYDINPYKYLAKCDLFVCSSYAEGFSTTATEALIVGTPICTVDVSGMKEMLGEDNEYGIVTENNEDDLYIGIKNLLDNGELLEYYRVQAKKRGEMFCTDSTVKAVENMLLGL